MAALNLEFYPGRYCLDVTLFDRENQKKMVASLILNAVSTQFIPIKTISAIFTNTLVTYLGRWPAIHQGNYNSQTLRLISKVAIRALSLTAGACLLWATGGAAITFEAAFFSVTLNQFLFDVVGF